jgi:hypothetical protein
MTFRVVWDASWYIEMHEMQNTRQVILMTNLSRTYVSVKALLLGADCRTIFNKYVTNIYFLMEDKYISPKGSHEQMSSILLLISVF